MRYFLLALLLPALCFAQPTTQILDTFDGTEQPITTNWTGGITGTGDCDKVSGVLQNRAAAGDESCHYDVSTFGQKQEMFFTIPNAASWALDVTARAHLCLIGGVGTASVDGYGLRLRPVTGTNNDVVQLFRTIDAGAGNIGSSYAARDFANGDKYAIIVDGSNFGTEVTFEVFLDSGGGWTSIITHTENTTLYDCSNSHQGFEIPDSSHQIDDYGGGNTVTGIPGIMILEAN